MRWLVLAVVLWSGSGLAAPPRKVSLELVNADVQTVLRLFADVGRFNLVTSEEVSGKVTLHLRAVPWDEAFRVVLASKGLGVERIGEIVRVAPLNRLAEESEARRKAKEAAFLEKPLTMRLIPVSYANASDLVAQVKAGLSPRGTVSVDTRTNTLIIRDVE
ncbi:MAG: secretin and TonB N-terminal domain-containing protein [Myxococcaceae bacterium]|nr:secretin and TonB N-terminal domain-containing protein [Myxococcaceae bacterium]